MNIEFKSINDFAIVISGYAFKSEWFGTGSDKVIRIGDLQDNLIDINSALTVDAKSHKVSDNFKIHNNDILIALSGATVGKIAVASTKDIDAYINQRVAIIRANNPITANYLKFFFSGKYLDELLKNAGGAAQPNLSPKQLSLMKIPLPPLEEQRRIAKILDKADALIQNRKKAIEKLDELLQATFIDMFGDPVTNPKGWDIKSLSEIAEYFNGLTYKPTDVSNEGTVILRSSNIQNSSLDLNDIVKVKSTIKDKLFVRENDILMCSRNGSARLVGKVALIPKLNEKMAFGAFMMIIRSHEYSQYLYSYFQTNAFRASIVSGATTTINQITNNMLNRVLLPIPDQQTLSVFSKFCINLNEQKQKMQEQLEVQETLFKSLQQQAFSGQL
ncbi:Hypothetical protein F387_01950 [Wohlfahrtiimonas chitiniclastica SH04]|uniref:Type I restriction modification DNA specificity domain-containing protein n=1 Tax=Wohlfahrtiimonas chitiniclastica SH04 TaxID=1261130 RepID=L8XTJ6_9GAMM|nr:restriction endonuclease subunit S [Wohlfahrtiimonas chitiniclastica]ELV07227.1 Hypothetical protein F387_01950 [Wohlfahrtiimonas chitiniclastica SH04]